MNAGGVSKACKSNDPFYFGSMDSGKRVSNTLVTYPEDVNNSLKKELIHDNDGGTQVIPI